MDDYNVGSLNESKNEWCSRLLIVITPHIIDGIFSIFNESYKLCKENREMDKYLMTFQNLITRIPKWNSTIIEDETKRIIAASNCSYLEDLISCVHIIQLKLLSAIRVGQKQKKIDIAIPKLSEFIHKVYVNIARKLYKNVYLFELGIPPLQIQKHNRELEIIVQQCILNTVRDSIPIESILSAYLDETIEEEVTEEIKEDVIPKPEIKETQIISEEKHDGGGNGNSEDKLMLETNFGGSVDHRQQEQPPIKIEEAFPDLKPADNIEHDFSIGKSKIKFNDIDFARDVHGSEELIEAPKTVERLEEISKMRNDQRNSEEENNYDDNDNEKINISGENVMLDFDIIEEI
jgi:hypothetical protein